MLANTQQSKLVNFALVIVVFYPSGKHLIGSLISRLIKCGFIYSVGRLYLNAV